MVRVVTTGTQGLKSSGEGAPAAHGALLEVAHRLVLLVGPGALEAAARVLLDDEPPLGFLPAHAPCKQSPPGYTVWCK